MIWLILSPIFLLIGAGFVISAIWDAVRDENERRAEMREFEEDYDR